MDIEGKPTSSEQGNPLLHATETIETDSLEGKVNYLEGRLAKLRDSARDSSYAYSINFKRMIETVKIDAALGSLIVREGEPILGDIDSARDSYLEKADEVGVDMELARDIFTIIVEASQPTIGPGTDSPLEGIGDELQGAIIKELQEHADSMPEIWQGFLDNLHSRTIYATEIGMVKLAIKLLAKIKRGEASENDVFSLDTDDVIDEKQKKRASGEFIEFCTHIGIEEKYAVSSYDAIHDSAVRAQLQTGELSYGEVMRRFFDEEFSQP